jgi:hypothetical protein
LVSEREKVNSTIADTGSDLSLHTHAREFDYCPCAVCGYELSIVDTLHKRTLISRSRTTSPSLISVYCVSFMSIDNILSGYVKYTMYIKETVYYELFMLAIRG